MLSKAEAFRGHPSSSLRDAPGAASPLTRCWSSKYNGLLCTATPAPSCAHTQPWRIQAVDGEHLPAQVDRASAAHYRNCRKALSGHSKWKVLHQHVSAAKELLMRISIRYRASSQSFQGIAVQPQQTLDWCFGRGSEFAGLCESQ